jgi:hypothetical protein
MAKWISAAGDDDSEDFDRYEFQAAMVELLGSDSKESYRIVSQLSQTYDRMLATYKDGGGKETEEAIFKIIPARVFELAASLKWIPYFLEHESPDNISFPFPEVDGCCEVLPTTGWRVESEMWEAFLRLLPIDQFADVYPVDPSAAVGKEWKRPTPRELVEGFVNRKAKGRPRRTKTWLALQMLKTDGFDVGEDAARQFIKLRCTEPESKQNRRSTHRGQKQALALIAACGKSPLLGVQTCDLRNVWDV